MDRGGFGPVDGTVTEPDPFGRLSKVVGHGGFPSRVPELSTGRAVHGTQSSSGAGEHRPGDFGPPGWAGTDSQGGHSHGPGDFLPSWTPPRARQSPWVDGEDVPPGEMCPPCIPQESQTALGADGTSCARLMGLTRANFGFCPPKIPLCPYKKRFFCVFADFLSLLNLQHCLTGCKTSLPTI